MIFDFSDSWAMYLVVILSIALYLNRFEFQQKGQMLIKIKSEWSQVWNELTVRWKQSWTKKMKKNNNYSEKNWMLSDVMFVSFWCLCCLSLPRSVYILFVSFEDRMFVLFVRAKVFFDVFVVFVVEASRRFWTAHHSAYHLENSIYATLYTRHLHRFQLFVLVWETQKMAMLFFHSLMDNIFLCVLLCFLTLSCFLFNSLRFFSESCEFKRLLIHIILHNTSAFFK